MQAPPCTLLCLTSLQLLRRCLTQQRNSKVAAVLCRRLELRRIRRPVLHTACCGVSCFLATCRPTLEGCGNPSEAGTPLPFPRHIHSLVLRRCTPCLCFIPDKRPGTKLVEAHCNRCILRRCCIFSPLFCCRDIKLVWRRCTSSTRVRRCSQSGQRLRRRPRRQPPPQRQAACLLLGQQRDTAVQPRRRCSHRRLCMQFEGKISKGFVGLSCRWLQPSVEQVYSCARYSPSADCAACTAAADAGASSLLAGCACCAPVHRLWVSIELVHLAKLTKLQLTAAKTIGICGLYPDECTAAKPMASLTAMFIFVDTQHL